MVVRENDVLRRQGPVGDGRQEMDGTHGGVLSITAGPTGADTEAQLARIILIARNIAAISEELLREIETERCAADQDGAGSPTAHRLAAFGQVGPRILAASEEQLTALLGMMRRTSMLP
jgi:hypothetical protein